MDEKKRKHFSFNIIDLVLIIILVLILAVLAYVFFLGKNNTKSADLINIEYTVQMDWIYDELTTEISEGDEVTETTNIKKIGTVSSVTVKPFLTQCEINEDGSIKYGEYPGCSNITVKIRTKAEKTPDGYKVDGYTFTIGSNVCIRTPGFLCSGGYCTDITEVD